MHACSRKPVEPCLEFGSIGVELKGTLTGHMTQTCFFFFGYTTVSEHWDDPHVGGHSHLGSLNSIPNFFNFSGRKRVSEAQQFTSVPVTALAADVMFFFRLP